MVIGKTSGGEKLQKQFEIWKDGQMKQLKSVRMAKFKLLILIRPTLLVEI